MGVLRGVKGEGEERLCGSRLNQKGSQFIFIRKADYVMSIKTDMSIKPRYDGQARYDDQNQKDETIHYMAIKPVSYNHLPLPTILSV